MEPAEPVDTHRDKGGHAPIAGVGDMVGDGHSWLNEGRSGVSCVLAILASMSWFPVYYRVYSAVVESTVPPRQAV